MDNLAGINFRVIHGAVTLKHVVVDVGVEHNSGFPRHSWRGHIEALQARQAGKNDQQNFRVIHGAVTLKLPFVRGACVYNSISASFMARSH